MFELFVEILSEVYVEGNCDNHISNWVQYNVSITKLCPQYVVGKLMPLDTLGLQPLNYHFKEKNDVNSNIQMPNL